MESIEPTTADVSNDGATAASDYSGTSNSTTAPATGVRGKLDTAKEKVVTASRATADWFKEQDVDSLKAGIENQVKAHPTRTLLIALGIGYVLGRALRRDGT